MGNGQCQQNNLKSEMNMIITEENVHSDESEHNLTSKITDKVYKVNFVRNELIQRLQSINQDTLLYLTELVLQLNKYTISQLKTMMIGAHKTYQILIQSIIKLKPENNEIIPFFSEEINNLKLLYELSVQPAHQLYYRPIYNENYEIVREIRVKRIRNYVLKEDTVTDLQKAQKRLQNWLQISQEKNPNLLNLRAGVIQKNTCKYLTDYIDGTTLDKFQNKRLSSAEKNHLAFQMIESVRTLHQSQLVHGDIKPSNFIVTQQLNLILIDLDQLGAEKQSADMTYLYTFQDDPYPTFQGDVWSLGLCLYSLYFGQRIEKKWLIDDYKKRDFFALSIKSYGPIQPILEATLCESPKDIWYISSLCKQL